MGNQTGLIDYFVHNMLDYSILFNNDETFTKEKNNFDILLCMKEIYALLEDKVNFKEIKLSINVDGFEDTKFVNTDKKRFSQVLLNLLLNAIKFTDRNGTIKVEAVNKKNGFIKVFVRDSGIGIQKED